MMPQVFYTLSNIDWLAMDYEGRDFEFNEIGGTLVFFNEDQSVSGEVHRSSTNVIVMLDKNSDPITEEEKEYLQMYYLQHSNCRTV